MHGPLDQDWTWSHRFHRVEFWTFFLFIYTFLNSWGCQATERLLRCLLKSTYWHVPMDWGLNLLCELFLNEKKIPYYNSAMANIKKAQLANWVLIRGERVAGEPFESHWWMTRQQEGRRKKKKTQQGLKIQGAASGHATCDFSNHKRSYHNQLVLALCWKPVQLILLYILGLSIYLFIYFHFLWRDYSKLNSTQAKTEQYELLASI